MALQVHVQGELIHVLRSLGYLKKIQNLIHQILCNPRKSSNMLQITCLIYRSTPPWSRGERGGKEAGRPDTEERRQERKRGGERKRGEKESRRGDNETIRGDKEREGKETRKKWHLIVGYLFRAVTTVTGVAGGTSVILPLTGFVSCWSSGRCCVDVLVSGLFQWSAGCSSFIYHLRC